MPIEEIPIGLIDEPTKDLRAWRDPSFADALRKDIEKEGLLTYPIVRRKAKGRFELMDGITRIRQLKKLGKDKVFCDVRECDDKDALIVGLKVGMKRLSQDPMGLAKSFKRLKDDYEMRLRDIADRFGFSRGYVSKLLALNRLAPSDQEALAKGKMNIEYAYRSISRKLGSKSKEWLEQSESECEACGSKKRFYDLETMRVCGNCKALLMGLIGEQKREAEKRKKIEKTHRRLDSLDKAS
jgi:ParB/RepB/Spo0J family partition protein